MSIYTESQRLTEEGARVPSWMVVDAEPGDKCEGTTLGAPGHAGNGPAG